MIFSYLCYSHSHHPANMVSPDDIARDVHVTVSTAKKYLSVLVNTGLVSGMLGHYSAGFTLDTYTHVTTSAKKEAANTMGSFLSGALQ